MDRRDIKPILLIILIAGIFTYQYNLSVQYSDRLMNELHADDPVDHHQWTNNDMAGLIYQTTTFPSMEINEQVMVSWYLNFTALDTTITVKIDGIKYGSITNNHNGSVIISDINGIYDVAVNVNSGGIELGGTGYVIDLYLW